MSLENRGSWMDKETNTRVLNYRCRGVWNCESCIFKIRPHIRIWKNKRVKGSHAILVMDG
jgi:hypothetical protein